MIYVIVRNRSGSLVYYKLLEVPRGFIRMTMDPVGIWRWDRKGLATHLQGSLSYKCQWKKALTMIFQLSWPQ